MKVLSFCIAAALGIAASASASADISFSAQPVRATPIPNAPLTPMQDLVRKAAFLGADGLWYGKVCSTPFGSCFTINWTPVGNTCYCSSAGGWVAGSITN